MTRKPCYSNGTGIRRVYSAESWKDMLLLPVYIVPMHPLAHQTVLVVSYLQYLQRLLQCALCPKHDDCYTMSTEVKVVACSIARLADVASCHRLLFLGLYHAHVLFLRRHLVCRHRWSRNSSLVHDLADLVLLCCCYHVRRWTCSQRVLDRCCFPWPCWLKSP